MDTNTTQSQEPRPADSSKKSFGSSKGPALSSSKGFRTGVSVLGIVLIVLVSFAAGVAVGFRKARYSFAWGENYERHFMGGPRMEPRGFMPPLRKFEGRDLRNAHGAAGTIVSIAGDKLIVKDRDDKENTVAVTDKTLVKFLGENLSVGDLRPNDRIVVIGRPGEDGVVNADIIRVFERSNQ